MEKNKNGLEKDKKKKLPFNVLSKKGLMGLALAGVMMVSPFMLAGCSNGQDGKDGAPGTIWKSGTSYTQFVDAKDGDYFIDTDDFILYQKVSGTWSVVMENYGRPGTPGQPGTPGAPATAPTITIVDDYWHIDGVSTGVKAKGEDGQPGFTPKVEIKDGFWYINDVKSVKAEAQDGHTPIITINQDGYWVIDGIPTQTKATPSVITIVEGYWHIDGVTTGVRAEGKDGKDGNTWNVGTEYPTNPNTGDMFLNNSTWEVYQYNGTIWESKGNIKGEKGENGTSESSIYVGYDGYIWNGTQRTDILNTSLNEDIAENTLELYNNIHFTETKISTNKHIALMGNYLPKAMKTGYSGSKITELSIYVEEDGIIEIGTACVEDVVNSRKNGTALTAHSIPYNVTAGKNTITLNLSISETDTIVIGGGTSNVNVYSYQGVNGIDEFGFYTICNEETNSELFENNNLIKNKLAIQVKAKGITTQETGSEEALLPDLLTEADAGKNSWLAVTIASAPFAYDSQVVFESGIYTKVDIPVVSFSSLETEQFMTMYVVDLNYQNNTISNIIRKYKVVVPTEGFSGTDINDWVSVDLRENTYLYNADSQQYEKCNGILVENYQSIAFGDASDNTLTWGYETKSYQSKYKWCGKITSSPVKIGASSLLFNFYLGTITESFNEITFAEHLENLKELEDSSFSLNSLLEGKKLSVLGDSISTYENVSNNIEYNSTLSNNAVCKYYKTGADKSVELTDTYWQQLINDYNMELCVNNSWSGSFVTKSAPTNGVDSGGTLSNGMTRSTQLHNDNTNTTPDYIIVNIGINDFNAGKTCGIIADFAVIEENDFIPSNFAESYAVMIHNIVTNYNQAEVIVFTLPDYAWNDNDSLLAQYNTTIKNIAEHYGCIVVDMFENSGLNDTSAQQGNKTVDGLHPNADGFDMITACLVDELSKYYQTNNN